ncbi:MAG TPA: hypothetical protein VJI52_00735 [Candidatus Nanoarchaeia archaeon]|nr:hypothetical protein [Candidatus Nanoarchaeia archaeon]
MKVGNHDLSGNNLVLYEGSAFNHNAATLVNRGTLEDCLLPEEFSRRIVLLPGSQAVKRYGIGFLKEGVTYETEKTVTLDSIRAIAGYGTALAWEDFIRRVKLERLTNNIIAGTGIIV